MEKHCIKDKSCFPYTLTQNKKRIKKNHSIFHYIPHYTKPHITPNYSSEDRQAAHIPYCCMSVFTITTPCFRFLEIFRINFHAFEHIIIIVRLISLLEHVGELNT